MLETEKSQRGCDDLAEMRARFAVKVRQRQEENARRKRAELDERQRSQQGASVGCAIDVLGIMRDTLLAHPEMVDRILASAGLS